MSRIIYPNPTDSFLLVLPPFTLKSSLSFCLPCHTVCSAKPWSSLPGISVIIPSLLYFLFYFLHSTSKSILMTQIVLLPSLNFFNYFPLSFRIKFTTHMFCKTKDNLICPFLSTLTAILASFLTLKFALSEFFVPFAWIFFLQLLIWLAPFPPSDLSSNVISQRSPNVSKSRNFITLSIPFIALFTLVIVVSGITLPTTPICQPECKTTEGRDQVLFLTEYIFTWHTVQKFIILSVWLSSLEDKYHDYFVYCTISSS